ncbi:MAG: hypothetical protein NTY81_02935 [Candidatus Staskawiczbacteria bacterium]|nr:hypothetical protein [Candidatus Staskawiczbacteria bacterium]
MDSTSLIAIIIAIIVIYLFIKFVVSPVLRIIFGVIIFLILIYLLQRFFGLNLDEIFAHFGISLNSSKWGPSLNWLLSPVNYCTDQIISFFNFIWKNVPKSSKF